MLFRSRGRFSDGRWVESTKRERAALQERAGRVAGESGLHCRRERAALQERAGRVAGESGPHCRRERAALQERAGRVTGSEPARILHPMNSDKGLHPAATRGNKTAYS